MDSSTLALDIGGANLKAAHSAGIYVTQPFALWKEPASLPNALRRLFAGMPEFNLVAVTMTGELCDCFATKREGVVVILDAVETAADSIPVRVWRTDAEFVDLSRARVSPQLCVAANWLALATYVGRFVPRGTGLLIDVGSTTIDLVPLLNGSPNPSARTDPDRLRRGELVYTGVRRTPLCAMMGFDGAAEMFATTLDIHLIRGSITENEADCDTADGKPATRRSAMVRLARMKCADLDSFTEAQINDLAEILAEKQLNQLRTAIRTVLGRYSDEPNGIVVSGSGEFLARAAARGLAQLDDVPIISLSTELSASASEAACAYALMVIAGERR